MDTRSMSVMEEHLFTLFLDAEKERDEARADRDALAAALKHLRRLVAAIVRDKPAEEYYGSMWGELRIGAAEARTALATYYRRSE